MQYLEFSTDFRTQWYYSNIMYGLAEHVLETIEGRSWKDIVRTNIYQVDTNQPSGIFIYSRTDSVML